MNRLDEGMRYVSDTFGSVRHVNGEKYTKPKLHNKNKIQ